MAGYFLLFLCMLIVMGEILCSLSDKKVAPKAANDVKLINAGKILENNKTVAQCKMPFGELPKGIITMHAVVQPSLAKAKTGKLFTYALCFEPACESSLQLL